MFRILAAFAVLLVSVPAVAAQGVAPDRIDVAGIVADASTGEPLSDAAISIKGTMLRVLTNDDGRFLLRGIPTGEQTWVIERLGYATWEQPLEARHLDQLRIGLMARPIALEEITVTVNRLEERRKLSGLSVHTVDREALRSSPAIDAVGLVRSRMPWPTAGCGGGSVGPTLVPTAGPGGEPTVPDQSSLRDPGQRPWFTTDLCIRYRGNVSSPRVCIDETPISPAMLAAYSAEEIYAVDYVGGAAPQIRVYTERFLESGKPIRPFGFGCR